ncbi:uncharacterized protein LOC143858197 [Tasmannia lanceolata]|uniref:uncharacterized protein LOC143858197 n=1 Tax=Tasmannia lanceolata TaxID=3420 RepID=UPI0040630B6A
MERSTLHLLVFLLGLSHLISLNAVPLSRSQSLFQEPQNFLISVNTQQKITNELWEDELINGRMDLEINNDYPGIGANNRHNPKPPPGGKR